MASIFISYSRSDKVTLKHLLLPPLQEKREKDEIWYDDGIIGGSAWWEEILKRISICDVLVYLMSNEAIESEYCEKELNEALRLKKPILPIIVRRLKPDYPGESKGQIREYLSRTQHINLASEMTDADIDKINASIDYLISLSSSSIPVQANRLREFSIIKSLGSGGFGEVFFAKQAPFLRDVALKIILPSFANQLNFINRFEKEAQLIAKLEHPHIVPVYDLWRDTDGIYMGMRFMRGGNLADKLAMGAIFSPQNAAKLLEQIASALDAAHSNKVIHQDIKPSNILFDEYNNAYVVDFGLALDNSGGINLAENDNGTMHGSPKYISPEHLRRKEITNRSDIYSLGLVMYEALTGFPPFAGTQLIELLMHHTKTPTPSLQNKAPHLPLELDEPIKKATAKDPNDRYDNVLSFAEDFRKVVNRL